MKYPKYNGKEFDSLHKKEFDHWFDIFKWTIEISKDKLTKEEIKMLAWNCAYQVITCNMNAVKPKK